VCAKTTCILCVVICMCTVHMHVHEFVSFQKCMRHSHVSFHVTYGMLFLCYAAFLSACDGLDETA